MAQAVFTHRPAATGIRDYTHTHRDIGGVLFRRVLNRFTPIFLPVTFTVLTRSQTSTTPTTPTATPCPKD
jgi:hypothetical protein